jgi:H+/Cl- antiporter ClcA
MLLGTTCGVVSFVFSQLAKLSKALFDGDLGPEPVRRSIHQYISYVIKPAIGGLLCGLIAIPFPQILFFGYEP